MDLALRLGCDFGKTAAVGEDTGKMSDAVASDIRDLQAWHTAIKPRMAEICNGFEFDIDAVTKQLINAASTSLTEFRSSLSRQLEQLTAEIKALLPAKALLDTAIIMRNEKQREALALMTKELHTSQKLKEAAEKLAMIQTLKDKAWGTLPGKAALTSVRRTGKLAIGLSWIVGEILQFQPEHPKDIGKFVDTVTEKLKCKGIHGGKDIGAQILRKDLMCCRRSCEIVGLRSGKCGFRGRSFVPKIPIVFSGPTMAKGRSWNMHESHFGASEQI